MSDDTPTLAEHLAAMTPAERAEVAEQAERVAEALEGMEGGRAVSLAVRTAATAVTKPIIS